METEQASGVLTAPSGAVFTSPFFLLFAVLQGQKIASSEKSAQGNMRVTEKPDLTFGTAEGCEALGLENRDRPWEMWISPDPARQFASPYAYSPNPINNIDPDGKQAKDVLAAKDIQAQLADVRQQLKEAYEKGDYDTWAKLQGEESRLLKDYTIHVVQAGVKVDEYANPMSGVPGVLSSVKMFFTNLYEALTFKKQDVPSPSKPDAPDASPPPVEPAPDVTPDKN